MTRQEYMNLRAVTGDTRALHHQYYLAVAKQSGISAARLPKDMLQGILDSSCPYLNTVPLKKWDTLARVWPAFEISATGKRVTCLSAGVCAWKAVALEWKANQSE